MEGLGLTRNTITGIPAMTTWIRFDSAAAPRFSIHIWLRTKNRISHNRLSNSREKGSLLEDGEFAALKKIQNQIGSRPARDANMPKLHIRSRTGTGLESLVSTREQVSLDQLAAIGQKGFASRNFFAMRTHARNNRNLLRAAIIGLLLFELNFVLLG